MSFFPPDFSCLEADIEKLNSLFFDDFQCYKVIPKLNEEKNATVLQLLIDRITVVISCRTDRTEHLEVLKQLLILAKTVQKNGDLKQCEQTTFLLLALLIDCYFTIIDECDNAGINKWIGIGIFAKRPRNSALFTEVREALGFKKYTSGYQYKIEDLKKLDPVTIVTCLNVLLSNMRLKDENGVFRYTQYSCFNNDSFLNQLQNKINTYKVLPVYHQFEAIGFIRTLSKCIASENNLINKGIDELIESLEKEHSDSDFKKLSLDMVREHLDKHISTTPENALKKKIEFLLSMKYLNENFNTLKSYGDLSNVLKQSNLATASYYISGGCALLLEAENTVLLKGRGVDKKIAMRIHQVLGIEKDPDALYDVEERYNHIRIFKGLITKDPLIALDYEFFNGLEGMKTAISQCEIHLIEKINEKINERKKTTTATTMTSSP